MAAFGTEDFIIDRHKEDVVSSHKTKIECLFNVFIKFGEVAVVEDGPKQWLVVSGAKSDRRSAKKYILALCCPEETFTLQCEGDLELAADILDPIEQETSAVIRMMSPSQLMLAGTALACTLALSRLEELYKITIVDTGGSLDLGLDVVDGAASGLSVEGMKQQSCNKRRSSSGAERLDKSLQKALSQVGDSSGGSEYSKASDAVKRVILASLVEYEEDGSEGDIIDDEELFGLPAKQFQVHETNRNSKPFAVVAPVSPGRPVSGSSYFADSSLPKQVAVDSPDCSQEAKCSQTQGAAVQGNAEAKETLRKHGLQMGYDPRAIDEALSHFVCLEKTAFFDFLPVLEKASQSIASNKTSILPQSSAVQPAGLSNSQMTASSRKEKTIPDPVHTSAAKKVHLGGSKAGNSPSASVSARQLDVCANDSIIIIGDSDADDSVCIVDAFPTKPPTGGIGGLSAEERQKMLQQQQQLKKQFEDQLLARSSQGRPGVETPPVPSKKKKPKKKVASQSEVVVRNKSEEWRKASGESFSLVAAGTAEKLPRLMPKTYSGLQAHGVVAMEKERYQDDEEQTCVLRPYGSDSPSYHSDRPCSSSMADDINKDDHLRFIVIDGSNVAMSHGNDKVFSCKGIELCVNYFLARGHKQITAFVPEWRRYRNQRSPVKVVDIEVLERLKNKGYLVFTPSRRLPGRWIASHDDRYILNLAVAEDGVVVSNDQYREFAVEKSTYRHIIENRLLQYSFVKNHFMPPDDPLGQHGPRLEEFLRKTPCKPLLGQTNKKVLVVPPQRWPHQPGQAQQPVSPVKHIPAQTKQPAALANEKRHPAVTADLFTALKQVFPNEEQDVKIREVLDNHDNETDLNRLTNYCMSALFL